MTVIELTPGQTTLAELERVVLSTSPVRLNRESRAAVTAAADVVAAVVERGDAVYGVNTGFGKLASVSVAAEDTSTLQRNLVLSHCCGVGEATPPQVTRLTMTLKLLSLGRGASGVRWELIELLEDMLEKEVMPLIPAQGSVGASGDLAPLAHLAAVMIGEGEAVHLGQTMSGADALEAAGLKPLSLIAKEGLALINGTQFSCSYALVALFDVWNYAKSSLVTASLSTDAIMGSTAPLRPEIHALRGHQGQIDVAAGMRELMAGSGIRESHREGDTRVQDPYCIRCQPQVAGACVAILRTVAETLRTEANAVTDNPLVIVDEADPARSVVLSGGNFHAEPVAFAADQIALAIAELGSIAQRRVALMVDPAVSFDLPPFLTPDPGLNSGFMVAEITTAALMSENKHLANPCSTDSTPTSANQEDHVSMAAHAARRLVRMNENLATILGIELLCAARGIEFRQPLLTSPRLQAVISQLRESIPTLKDDRYMADDLRVAAQLINSGVLITKAGIDVLPPLEKM